MADPLINDADLVGVLTDAEVMDADGVVDGERVRVGALGEGWAMLEIGTPGAVGNVAIMFNVESLTRLIQRVSDG